MPINVRTIWPAVMLAASRNERVSGRERVLVVSTITKNGVNHDGAALGARLARVWIRLYVRADRISESHSGNPSLAVKIIWLVRLNM